MSVIPEEGLEDKSQQHYELKSLDNDTRSTGSQSRSSSSSSSSSNSTGRSRNQDSQNSPSDNEGVPPPADDFISSFLEEFKNEWEQEATSARKREAKKKLLKLQCNVCRLQTSSCTCGNHGGEQTQQRQEPNTNASRAPVDTACRCPICRLELSSCICDAGQGPMPDVDALNSPNPWSQLNHDDSVSSSPTQQQEQQESCDPHYSARQLDLLTTTVHSSENPYEDLSHSNDGVSSLEGSMSMSYVFNTSPKQQQQQHATSNHSSHRSAHSGSHESLLSQTNHTTSTPARRLDALTRSTHSGDGITPYEDDDDNEHQYHERHFHQDSFVCNDEGRLAYPGYSDGDDNSNSNYHGAYDDSFLITDEEQGETDVYADEGYDEDGGYGFRSKGRGRLSSSLANHHHHHHHPGKAYLGSVNEIGETDDEHFDDDDDDEYYGHVGGSDDDDNMTVDSYDRRKKWIPTLLFCGGCLALVLGLGVGAGLGVVLTGGGKGTDDLMTGDASDSTPQLRPPSRDKDTSPTISPTQAPTATSWVELGEELNTTATPLFLGKGSFDNFGKSVALSGDGTIVAVGVPNGGIDNRGSVQVFQYYSELDEWERLGRELVGRGSGSEFGSTVTLSRDGRTVATGAHMNDGEEGSNSGFVRIYQYLGGNWEQIGQDLEGDFENHLFGCAVSMSADATILAVGSCGDNNGQAVVYQYDSTRDRWGTRGDPIIGRGSTIALSGDGTVLVAGASGLVQAYRYLEEADSWVPMGDKLVGDRSGTALALSDDGERVAVGREGLVQIYEFRKDDWGRQGQALVGTAPNDGFGKSVAMSANGNIVAVGALYSDFGSDKEVGQARLFRYTRLENIWEPFGKTLYGDTAGDNFGVSIALSDDGHIVATGANADIDEETPDVGRVSVWQIDL